MLGNLCFRRLNWKPPTSLSFWNRTIDYESYHKFTNSQLRNGKVRSSHCIVQKYCLRETKCFGDKVPKLESQPHARCVMSHSQMSAPIIAETFADSLQRVESPGNGVSDHWPVPWPLSPSSPTRERFNTTFGTREIHPKGALADNIEEKI